MADPAPPWHVQPPVGWIDHLVVRLRLPILALCGCIPLILLGLSAEWLPQKLVPPTLWFLIGVAVFLSLLCLSPRTLLNLSDDPFGEETQSLSFRLSLQKSLKETKAALSGRAPVDRAAYIVAYVNILGFVFSVFVFGANSIERIISFSAVACCILLEILHRRRVSDVSFKNWRDQINH